MALAPGDLARVQVSWNGTSGLPADRIVNTFHFNMGPLTDGRSSVDECYDAVRAFYNDVQTETGARVSQYLGGGAQAGDVRVYNLSEPEPRLPAIRPMVAADWPARAGLSATMPFEVAAVVSWGTDVVAPKPGMIGARGRGRLYLGPLADLCKSSDASGVILLPQARLTFAHAARKLLLRSGLALVVHSELYNRNDAVKRGFIDNAFDTQRRRGTKASNRATFTPGAVVVPAA